MPTPFQYTGCGRKGGFTLVELLFALAIFSVLAMLAYGGLRSVLDSQEYMGRQAARLARLQLVYRIMSQDVQQAVQRSIRNEFGDTAQPLEAGSDPDRKLEFTRGGWRNPAGQLRSSLQRVAYRIKEDRLVRETWVVLDRAQDSKPREQDLLDHVEDLQIRMLDAQDGWQDTWPPLATTDLEEGAVRELPRAIEFTLELEDWGSLVWLFQLTV